MAWNEPGGGNRDPWGGKNRDQGPPDLDEVIRKLSAKLGGLFGGRPTGAGSSGGDGGGTGGGAPVRVPSGKGVWLIVGIVVLGWLASGIYIVQEGTRGVVLRFGAYVDTTMPGPHWRFPYPIERHEIVDVDQRRVMEIGYRSGGTPNATRQGAIRSVPREALMLTQDENIVDIKISVQYQVSNPRDFLFNVVTPEVTLQEVVESAVRETVGKSTMDYVLTEGRADIVADVKEIAQQVVDTYHAGIIVTNVNLQDAQPPDEVQDAFADAIKAREDEQRLINEAEAYANEILPIARGAAARELADASAYREQVIARAEGESSRFTQVLAEYQKAPGVTGERLYLDTMEAVLARSSKVIVDVDAGNSLLYLPLDRMVPGGSARTAGVDGLGSGVGELTLGSSGSGGTGGADGFRIRDTSRSREGR